jgi:uncharacterized repeat protein (TIGR04076 family)
MSERYVILVKVESIRGKCMRGHFPGEEWRILQKTPGGICMGAFASMLPAIRTLQFGGTFSWQKEPNVTRIGCIDPVNTVTFRIERLEETCPP